MHSIQEIPASLWLLFGALIVAIIVVSAVWRRRRARLRGETLRTMGFSDRPRDQAIEHAEVLACMIHDRPASSLSDVVATGQSEPGDTAIFEIGDGGGQDRVWTSAVAFRAPPGTPDFRMQAALLGDRLLPGGHDADIGVPASLSHYDRHSHQWSQPKLDGLDIPVMKRVAFPGDSEFSKDYYVWSSDADALRRMLTSEAIAALVAGKRHNPFILKRLGWLVIFGDTASTSPSPRHYPELLRQAVELVRHLDWKAARQSGPEDLDTMENLIAQAGTTGTGQASPA